MRRGSRATRSSVRWARHGARIRAGSRAPSGGTGSRSASGAGDALTVEGFCPPCAICGHCGRGDRVLHHLTHGLSVWLCDAHRSDGFMHRRSGREFVERLAAVWVASGILTVRKRQALAAHLRRIETAGMERDQPGSYSWPLLRREAERRFASGEPPAEVISELRLIYRDGPAMVPSIRTMRRWYTQARWLTSPPRNRRNGHPATARRSNPYREPLINLLLTGVAYPSASTPYQLRRGP